MKAINVNAGLKLNHLLLKKYDPMVLKVGTKRGNYIRKKPYWRHRGKTSKKACLSCDKIFVSLSSVNRLCPGCTKVFNNFDSLEY